MKILASTFPPHRLYVITNIKTQKRYVGHTTTSLTNRAANHSSYANAGDNRDLYQAIREYGDNNFTIQQIDTAHTLEEVDEKEKRFIQQYNSLVPNGYNLASGGRYYKHHKKSKIKNSIQHQGTHASIITKQKISKASRMQPTGAAHPRSHTFVAISPNGEKQILCGIKQFCRDHNLPTNSFRRLLCSGKPMRTGKNKGWRFETV
jgi:GIY-YIG catalytic domain.